MSLNSGLGWPASFSAFDIEATSSVDNQELYDVPKLPMLETVATIAELGSPSGTSAWAPRILANLLWPQRVDSVLE